MAKKSAPKWIQAAVPKANEGKFTAKAKRAGMGVQEYAAKVTKKGSKASTTTKREANFAKNMNKMAKKHKKSRK